MSTKPTAGGIGAGRSRWSRCSHTGPWRRATRTRADRAGTADVVDCAEGPHSCRRHRRARRRRRRGAERDRAGAEGFESRDRPNNPESRPDGLRCADDRDAVRRMSRLRGSPDAPAVGGIASDSSQVASRDAHHAQTGGIHLPRARGRAQRLRLRRSGCRWRHAGDRDRAPGDDRAARAGDARNAVGRRHDDAANDRHRRRRQPGPARRGADHHGARQRATDRRHPRDEADRYRVRAALNPGQNRITVTAENFKSFEAPKPESTAVAGPIVVTRTPSADTGVLDLATAYLVTRFSYDFYWLCGESDDCGHKTLLPRGRSAARGLPGRDVVV